VIVRFVDIGGIVDHHCNINKTNNHLSPKESLNSDGPLFHQYQQSEQSHLKSKLKQRWSTIPPISSKRFVDIGEIVDHQCLNLHFRGDCSFC
jgi:hypothetical protein